MPHNRFVSRDAENGLKGSLKTVPLRLPGKASQLTINADSSRGEIRVRVCEASGGQALPVYNWADCRPIIGKGHELPVEWRRANKLPSRGKNASAQLEVEFKKSDLYGYRIVKEPGED